MISGQFLTLFTTPSSSCSPASPCSWRPSRSTTRSRSSSPSAPGRTRCCVRSAPSRRQVTATDARRGERRRRSSRRPPASPAASASRPGSRRSSPRSASRSPRGPLVISGLSMLLPLGVGILVCPSAPRSCPPYRPDTHRTPGGPARDGRRPVRGSRRRAVVGTALGVAAVAVTLVPGVLGGRGPLVLLGLGAAAALFGVVDAGAAARPTGRPAARGVPAAAAGSAAAPLGENAVRNPRRTAATASRADDRCRAGRLDHVVRGLGKRSVTASIDQDVPRRPRGRVGQPGCSAGSTRAEHRSSKARPEVAVAAPGRFTQVRGVGDSRRRGDRGEVSRRSAKVFDMRSPIRGSAADAGHRRRSRSATS